MPNTQQLIEEALERFDAIKKEWDLHYKLNSCSICDSPEQHTDLREFFKEELTTIARRSAEAERTNTLQVIKSIRSIANSLYEVQQRLENEKH